MPKIFLSYRREDSAGVAGRIYDRLRAHFGDGAVFMDIDSIPFGEDFRKHIDAAVGQCDVILAVIGTKWAGETDAHRRLDDATDFVRIEIESALKRDIPVIPILIDRTSMPTEAELPRTLAGVTYRNAIEVDQGRDFHPHVDRLVRGIEFHFERAKTATTPPSSQPQEAAARPLVAKEPERARNVSHTELEPRPRPAPTVEPRPDSPPSTSDPGQPPNADRQGAESSKPKPLAEPAGVINAEGLPRQTRVASLRQEPAVSSQLVGAPPKRRNIPWLWFYVAALPLLAFLGVIIYVLTLKRPPTERAGNKKAASPGPSGAGELKPASSSTQVRPFKAPPPQPERERTNSIGIKLVRIEAGEFLMGTTKDQVDQLMRQFPDSKREWFDDEQPQHPVKITRPFFLGIHEVTVGQFRRFVETSGYQTEAEKDGKGSYVWDETKKAWELDPSKNWRNPGFPQTDDHPVVCVSHNDAMAFCQWLSQNESRTYRLPTEAEWEFACRGDTTALYSNGNDPEGLVSIANVADASLKRKSPYFAYIKGDDGYPYTASVGSFAPNRWAVYDMIGNVWEWCADWYDEKYYASSPATDPPGAPKASLRVVRGGSWGNYPRDCRPTDRNRFAPAFRSINFGFRVAAVQE